MKNAVKVPLMLSLSVALSLPAWQACAAHVPPGTKLAKKQILVRGNDSEAATLDPMKAEGLTEMHIIRDLFEGLVIQDGNGNVIPGIASSWENKNNQIYTFHLRKNATWSDGTPLTAHDFVYSLRRAVNPESASPNAWYLKMTEIKNAGAIISGKKKVDTLGVKALDAHTLQFTLDKPVPYFIAMTAHTVMMPVPESTIKKYGDKWARPGHMISNGAFTLNNWVVNERVELKKNPHYWDSQHTVLTDVVYIPFENQMAAINRYMTGEVDITSDVPTQMAAKLRKDYPDAYRVTPLLCTYYYAFNTKHKPFDDVRVRKALSYAINRNIITRGVTDVGNVPAYTFAHKDVAGFQATQPPYASMTQEQRNREALQLLKQAGYDSKNPVKGTLLYNTSESNKSIAVAIASMWNKTLGTDITLENQEWKSYLVARKEGNFDIMRASWCGDYNEASTFLNLFTSDSEKNFAFYHNKAYDKAMNQAQTATQEKVKNTYYDEAEGILSKAMPVAPIYYYMQPRMVRPTIGGYPMHNAEGRIYSKDLYIKAK